MKEQSVNEFHVRYLILYELRKHSNALGTRTCQWFQSFRRYEIWKTCFHFYFKIHIISFYKKRVESLSERWVNIVNNDGDYITD